MCNTFLCLASLVILLAFTDNSSNLSQISNKKTYQKSSHVLLINQLDNALFVQL